MPQIAFFSGEQMEPIGIRASFPAAMFIARGWVSPDSSLSPIFANSVEDQVWGIAVGLGEDVDGDLVAVTLDDGRQIEAVLAEGLLEGDPKVVLANARYWESHPAFVSRLHAAVNPGLPEE